jgi:ribosome recycling factor
MKKNAYKMPFKKMTDKHIADVDAVLAAKEAELMEV